MNELKPSIKMKAPPTLKPAVMKAARRKRAAQRATIWSGWGVAASLLVGMLTFALWPSGEETTLLTTFNEHNDQPEKVATAMAEAATDGPSQQAETLSATVASQTTTKRLATTPHPRRPQAAAPALPTAHHDDEAAAPAPASAILTEAIAEATSHKKEQEEAPLSAPTPDEAQLMATLEENRDLVRARLADELSQAQFMQEQLWATQRKRIDDIVRLNEIINEHIQEAFATHETPKPKPI